MGSVVARQEDIDQVAACIADAFATDPIWSVALSRADGRTDHHEPYWRNVVEGAMRFGSVFQWDSGAAVSVWVPPEESSFFRRRDGELETTLHARAPCSRIRSSIHQPPNTGSPPSRHV